MRQILRTVVSPKGTTLSNALDKATEHELVSIIVPVHNAAGTLDRCIRSLLAQTYQDIEILLIDDASTDGSGELCDRYAAQDDRIITYHLPEQGGVARARNFALDHMTGALFMFADADDLVSKRYVQRLHEALTEHGTFIATCPGHDEWDTGIQEWQCEERRPSEVIEAADVDYRDNRSHRVVWGAIFRREALGDLRFHPEFQVSTDTLFFAEILLRCGECAYVDEPHYCYVQYPGSVSNGLYSWRRYDDIRVWKRVQSLHEKVPGRAHDTIPLVINRKHFNALILLSREKSQEADLISTVESQVRHRFEATLADDALTFKVRVKWVLIAAFPNVARALIAAKARR